MKAIERLEYLKALIESANPDQVMYTSLINKILEELNMKFKVGDKVRIREDLEVDKFYNGACFSKWMKEFMGSTVTISYTDPIGDYYIHEDKGEFVWDSQMFESHSNPYPKKMHVWDLEGESPKERTVLSEFNYQGRIFYIAESSTMPTIWRNAKDIEPKKTEITLEVTLEDIAKKFNVPIEQLKIKK